MRRVQFYLEDDAWNALHTRARQSGTSVSELVRQAVREKFLSGRVNRKEAMEALVGNLHTSTPQGHEAPRDYAMRNCDK